MSRDDQLLRLKEVQRRCGIARSSLYRLMARGDFPLPLKIGIRSVRWSSLEIEEWLQSRIRAGGYSRD